MMKLEKKQIIELLEKLPNDYCFECENAVNVELTLKELRKTLLKGNNTWTEYSKRGCAYISNCDIAAALCSPSEFSRTNGGEKFPNKYETWLDLQGRALFQAYFLIKSVIRAFGHQYYNKKL